ncbi:MAG: hypothetical protein M0000_13500 [Actinomycetota bacterium]|nr:hypothetical protein [Actinomycetota bacterium]
MREEFTRITRWIPTFGKFHPSSRVAMPGLLGILAVLLSGCLTNQYDFLNYTNPSGADMYFKVPANWSDFGPSMVFSSGSQKISPSQLAQLEAGEWANVFYGKRNAPLSAVTGIFSSHPFGIVQATKLNSAQHDTFSLSTLRTLLLPVDPLSKTSPTGGASYSATSYSEFATKSGMRGSRMVVRVKESTGATSVLDQVAEVDSSTSWVYLIGVGCSAKCYSQNHAVINEIVNSWSVRSR